MKRTFVLNEDYIFTYVAVLSNENHRETDYKKFDLKYYLVRNGGVFEELKECCHETRKLEKLARKWLTKNHPDFILWSY